MIFKEITSQEFDELALSHPLAFFQQSSPWSEVKSYTDWIAYYVKMEDDKGKVVALSMILGKRLPIVGKYMLYCPRGYLADYHDFKTLKVFTSEIKKFAKAKKAIFIKLDPYIPYKEHDSFGNLVEGGFDNSDCVSNLKKLGYKHNGFNLFYENIQPRWLMALDTKGKEYKDIESGYDYNVKWTLNNNLKSGIEVREVGKDELHIFVDLMDMTAKRRDFDNRPLSYYENMYDAFKKRDMIKIMVAEIDFDKGITNFQNQIDRIYQERAENQKKIDAGTMKVNPKKYQNRLKEEDITINSLNKKIAKLTKSKEEFGNRIPISSYMYITYGPEIILLLGGNDERFMEYSPSYSIYKYGIEYACQHKLDRFNFYGITGDFSKENDQYGMFDIKRRFGGNVLELIGQFTLVVSPFWNLAYNFAVKARNFIRRLK